MQTSSGLMLSILFGSIGMGHFVYGKKQGHLVALVAGLLLMVIPYFFENNYLLSSICVLVMLLPKIFHL